MPEIRGWVRAIERLEEDLTTIIRSGNVIVYESRLTRGMTIMTDEAEKKVQHKDIVFFFCGSKADEKFLIDAYVNGSRPPKEADAEAFIVHNGRVFRAGTHKGEFWYHEACDPDAIGSGSPYALTALDCGKNPSQALAMAIKRDACSGGKIRSYAIKRQP